MRRVTRWALITAAVIFLLGVGAMGLLAATGSRWMKSLMCRRPSPAPSMIIRVMSGNTF